MNKYRFGHRTADYYVCRECVAIPVVTNEIDGITVSLVNVRMIEEFDRSRADTTRHNRDDGEKIDDRLARRKRNWTGTFWFE